MRRTVWILLFTLLMQLVSASAWTMPAPESASHPAHGHETVAQDGTTTATHPQDSAQTSHRHTDNSHHCCAVGLGTGVQPLLAPLPQAAPTSWHGPWASLSLRPDLRPPI